MRTIAMVITWTMLYNFVFAGFAFADPNIDIRNTNNNPINVDANSSAQATGGTAQATGGEATGIGNVTVAPNLPVAVTHGVNLPSVSLNSYGNFITQMPATAFMAPCEPFTIDTYEFMITTLKDSGQDWVKMRKRITPYPYLKTRYAPLGKMDPVYFVDAATFTQMDKARFKTVGGFIYNGNYDKDEPILAPYFNLSAYEDAVHYGANVVVYSNSFFQGTVSSSAGGIELAGVLSWLSKGFTSGSSVGGSGGLTSGQTTEYGRPGMSYVFLRVEGLANLNICPPPPSIVIEKTSTSVVVPPICNEGMYSAIEAELFLSCKRCPDPCLNNAVLRTRRGDNYMAWWYCLGAKKENLDLVFKAIQEYGAARRDVANGWEGGWTKVKVKVKGKKVQWVLKKNILAWTKDLPQGQEILYHAEYNEYYARLVYFSKADANNFAAAVGLALKGDRTVPTNYNEMIK